MGDEVNKVQEEMISDVLEGIAAPAPAAEVPAEPAAASEEKPEGEKPAEEKPDEQKGEERKEEKAGEQVSTAGKPEEEKPKEEVAAKPAEEKPVEAAKPREEKEETEIEKIRRENTELRAHLEEMAGRTMEKPTRVLTPEQIEANKKRADAASKQVLKFLQTDEMYDEVTKNAANFNALLTSVVNTAVAKTIQMIPQITTQYVDKQMDARMAVQDFYVDNKDLLPHRKYVGFVSNEIIAKNPDWDLGKILVETEKEVRGRLKVAKGTGQKEEKPNIHVVDQNPGFVPGSGGGGRRGSVGTEKLSGEEKQIVDLLS